MMARPTDIAKRATAASRSKGGHARAAALRAKSEEERRLLAESRRDRLDAAIERLAELAEKAADTIGALLDDAESESVRLRAAVSLLDILDAAELRELSGRLEQLERSLSPNGGQG
jgi:hypothetical protein